MDMEPISQHGPGSFPSSESSLGHPRLLLLWEGAGGKERPCSITRLLRSGGFTKGHPCFVEWRQELGCTSNLKPRVLALGRCWLRRAGQIPLCLPALSLKSPPLLRDSPLRRLSQAPRAVTVLLPGFVVNKSPCLDVLEHRDALCLLLWMDRPHFGVRSQFFGVRLAQSAI